ncbi:MAG: GH39 family glycosyl hydrolase [Limnochordia bacterium]|jgi:hypothetical protein
MLTKKHKSGMVEVDFGQPGGYPIVKTKFGVYNSGIVPVEHYERDAEMFNEVSPHCLRIDLAWGADWSGWKKQPVTGSLEEIEYSHEEMDAIAEILNQRAVAPYWSYCYTPCPLQEPRGDWQSIPADMEKWGEILGEFAQHHKDTPAYSVGYHEIGNEPDGTNFFKGGLDDYLEMYYHGANKIKDADPDARIGGFALEYEDTWTPIFLSYVQDRDLPLDFFSFHFYGTNSPKRSTRQDLPELLETMCDYFAGKPEFFLTEFHLNEFNSFAIDYPMDGTQQKYPLATALLRDYKYFLSQPYLTLVLWAQFMDSGQGNFSGMVSIDGHRKAVFNAYKILSMMPVDRKKLTFSELPGLDGMASSDSHTASVVLWNVEEQERNVEIDFKNIPFHKGNLRCYRIDQDNSSWGDNETEERLKVTEDVANIDLYDYRWTGTIPGNGVMYLEINDGSGLSELTPRKIADVRRVLHFYPDRSSTAYADFDQNTWIARLGMAEEEQADLKIGATVEGLPDVLCVRAEFSGEFEKIDSHSMLGFRIDYMVDGVYTESALFYGTLNGTLGVRDSNEGTVIPWGTKRNANRIIKVEDLSEFHVDVKGLAPYDWNGRAQITIMMRNTGPYTSAKFTVS